MACVLLYREQRGDSSAHADRHQGVIMKRAGLGIGAALIAIASFANEPNQANDPNAADEASQENTQIAAVDADSTSFAKLDADTDGRISAIEASNDVKGAAAFTTADGDKDGYLSQVEFRAVGEAQGSTDAASESESADESELASESELSSESESANESESAEEPESAVEPQQ
jgi:clumping factor A